MKTVFLDTVGLIASWDSTDQWHSLARRAIDAMQSVRTVTTSFVLLECGNAAARRPYRRLVDQLRQTLQSGGKLIQPTADDWDQAWSNYSRGEAGSASIVDHVSFIVMRRMGITDAFTNDRHFKTAGFNTLF